MELGTNRNFLGFDENLLSYVHSVSSPESSVLDAGSFTGYSALCMALAMPDDGRLVGMKVDENNAKTALKYWKKAGVSHKMAMRVGPAVETMQALLNDGHGQTFDLLFIDADKPNYPTY